MKTDESQEKIINKRKIKNIRIKKLSSSKNKTNETYVCGKVKKKLNIKSDLIPYNKNKNLIINTNDIYNKKIILVRKMILYYLIKKEKV